MKFLTKIALAGALALSLAACSKNDSSTSTTNATSSSVAATAAPEAEAKQVPQAALDGVAGHVPIYTSNITYAPKVMAPGVYALGTSDSVATVLAWYKAHVSVPGVAWTTSGGAGEGGTSYHFIENANTTIQIDPNPRGGTAVSVIDK